MEKTHRSQLTGLNSDIDELRLQYEYVFMKIFSLINQVMWKEWLCCCRENSSVASAMQLCLQNISEKRSFAFVMM